MGAQANERVAALQADVTPLIAVAGASVAGLLWVVSKRRDPPPTSFEESVPLMNWSGTRQVTTSRLFTPENQQELRELVAWASKNKQKLRPLDTGLSPNGLALEKGGMLSMASLDRILDVDKEKMTITVEGGARVST